jgi:1,5-anhydro-D-fructose reductase (1,5-anhydro-D-mannitol-forming)
MDDAPALRWALVGASDIAATRMIPAMRALGHGTVVVMSSDAARASAYALLHGIERGTSSLAEAVGAPDVDAVYISTTNPLHAEQANAGVAAGKHVLCEKPLALTLEDAKAMVAAAGDAGVVMGTNHHLRSSPPIRTVQRAVAEGAVGEVLAVRVAHGVSLPERLRGWRIQDVPGGGVVLDITVHDADTVRFVTGLEVLEVAAVGFTQGLAAAGSPGVVDAVVTAGRMSGEVSLQLHDAYTLPHARTGFEVHGTEGSLIAADAMTQSPDGDVVLRRAGRDDDPVEPEDREDPYVRGVRRFAAAVAGDGEPAASGADGVRSLAVALAVEESLRTGRRADVPA